MTAASLVAAWACLFAATATLLLVARIVAAARRSIAERRRVIQAALAAAVALPLCWAASPGPRWRLPWRVWSEDAIAVATPSDAGEERFAATPGVRPFVVPRDSTSDAPGPAIAPAPVESTRVPVAERESAFGAALAWLARPWHALAVSLGAAYLAGAALFAAEWLVGRRRWKRLIDSASPASDDVTRLWERVAGERGRRATLRVSSDVASPMVGGCRRSTVLIPRALADGDRRSLEFCLRHEWAHVASGDLAWAAFVSLARVWLWPQPLFWSLRRELRLCQELAADARAAGDFDEAVEYAALLTSLARERESRRVAGAAALFDRSTALTRRVKMLLEGNEDARTPCSRRVAGGVALATAAVVMILGGLRLDAAPPERTATAVATGERGATVGETLRLSGVVVDAETGKGLPDATVVVKRLAQVHREGRLTESRFVAETRHATDAEGRYSFGVPPDQAAEPKLHLQISVEHADYVCPSWRPSIALSLTRKWLAEGKTAYFERLTMKRGEPVTGRVIGLDGRPAVGVPVSAYSLETRGERSGFGDRVRTRSDDEGRFRLMLHPGGEADFCVEPTDAAVHEQYLGLVRGDLGDVVLRPGKRVVGRVLDRAGEPVAGVTARLVTHRPFLGDIRWDSSSGLERSIRREAVTDAEGRFALDPLPPGEYEIQPSGGAGDLAGEWKRVPIDFYIGTKVRVSDDAEPAPLEVRPVETATFRARIVDPRGEPIHAGLFTLMGEIAGVSWCSQSVFVGSDGRATCEFPRGLRNASVGYSPNALIASPEDLPAYRHRVGPNGPWKAWVFSAANANLGDLHDDCEFETMRFPGAVAVLKFVDERGRPLEGVQTIGNYSFESHEYGCHGSCDPDVRLAGGRVRVCGLLPDEEFWVRATAVGREPATITFRLAEGERREIPVVMKRTLNARVYDAALRWLATPRVGDAEPKTPRPE